MTQDGTDHEWPTLPGGPVSPRRQVSVFDQGDLEWFDRLLAICRHRGVYVLAWKDLSLQMTPYDPGSDDEPKLNPDLFDDTDDDDDTFAASGFAPKRPVREDM